MMLIRGIWIVNKSVGAGMCDAPVCKVAPVVYAGEYMPKYIH